MSIKQGNKQTHLGGVAREGHDLVGAGEVAAEALHAVDQQVAAGAVLAAVSLVPEGENVGRDQILDFPTFYRDKAK